MYKTYKLFELQMTIVLKFSLRAFIHPVWSAIRQRVNYYNYYVYFILFITYTRARVCVYVPVKTARVNSFDYKIYSRVLYIYINVYIIE